MHSPTRSSSNIRQAKAQVLATGPMGTTNPPAPIFGTTINQNSNARLLSAYLWERGNRREQPANYSVSRPQRHRRLVCLCAAAARRGDWCVCSATRRAGTELTRPRQCRLVLSRRNGNGSRAAQLTKPEAEVVAWCVQPRNNARVIPDGTVTAAHFVKTPVYWQIQGWGDFTKLNVGAAGR